MSFFDVFRKPKQTGSDFSRPEINAMLNEELRRHDQVMKELLEYAVDLERRNHRTGLGDERRKSTGTVIAEQKLDDGPADGRTSAST